MDKVTPEPIYRARRAFMRGAVGATGAFTMAQVARAQESLEGRRPTPDLRVRGGDSRQQPAPDWLWDAVGNARKTYEEDWHESTKPNTEWDATHYNNFYELGASKSLPAENAWRYKPYPWTVNVNGHCKHPGNVSLKELVTEIALEERVYRLRCVEAWSMVIPWVGIPLAKLIEKFEPTSKAKYVAFTTVVRPNELVDQGAWFPAMRYPYVEGLRLDEATNPLALMVVGMYGKPLPGQNGAPMRLIVPWKYGFKSIKAITNISFTDRQPPNSWNDMAPSEYGFYANVNPGVSHPRWSQAQERRLPSTFFKPNWIPTQMFNGYSKWVEHMYKGLNLRINY